MGKKNKGVTNQKMWGLKGFRVELKLMVGLGSSRQFCGVKKNNASKEKQVVQNPKSLLDVSGQQENPP